MKKYLKVASFLLAGIALIIIFQNCSQSGKDLGLDGGGNYSSYSGSCALTLNGPTTVTTGSTVNVSFSSSAANGAVNLQAYNSTTNALVGSQSLSGSSGVYSFTAADAGNYVVTGALSIAGTYVAPCSPNVAFIAQTGSNPTPSCGINFTGTPQVGQTGTYNIVTSTSAAQVYIQLYTTTPPAGTSVGTGQTSYNYNHTFATADVGTYNAHAYMTLGGQTYNCTPNPLSQTVTTSGGGGGENPPSGAYATFGHDVYSFFSTQGHSTIGTVGWTSGGGVVKVQLWKQNSSGGYVFVACANPGSASYGFTVSGNQEFNIYLINAASCTQVAPSGSNILDTAIVSYSNNQ